MNGKLITTTIKPSQEDLTILTFVKWSSDGASSLSSSVDEESEDFTTIIPSSSEHHHRHSQQKGLIIRKKSIASIHRLDICQRCSCHKDHELDCRFRNDQQSQIDSIPAFNDSKDSLLIIDIIASNQPYLRRLDRRQLSPYNHR
ncbi:hypothetical protein BLA29_009979 [Euroglyphus maynei]|uniref:Uncharacterized protein n=1 Tax=Euroglyphus maynei TaxID=6958 RepID=A0A1Y3AUS1_EURMA|nr:hypothetical protein BLA29_009979 [Euroglyphus maynei]